MSKIKRRTRRSFSDDFKAEAVALVRNSGKSINRIAKDLDLTETALRAWVTKAAETGGGGGMPLDGANVWS